MGAWRHAALADEYRRSYPNAREDEIDDVLAQTVQERAMARAKADRWFGELTVLILAAFAGVTVLFLLFGCASAPAEDPCFIWAVEADGTRTCVELREDVERR